jgi:hypothetical protein
VRRVFLLLTLLLVALPQAAQAQTGARLNLRDLQTEAFPFITGYFDARDTSGARLADLQAPDVQILEDGAPQPIQQLRSVDPGLRVIVVITPAESFNIRNSQAQTRFDLVKQTMDAWVAALPSGSETFLSLVTPEGALVNDVSAADWKAALDSYKPALGATEVSVQSIAQALDLAAQPPIEPGMATAIWWITATPRGEALTALPDWQTTLTQEGVPLFIWQLDAPSTFDSEASQSLQTLVGATGAQRFTFSGGEVFPNPEDYFGPLRSVYFFQYSSQLRSAGEHQIAVQLQSAETIVASQSLTINLDIQPPSPILVAPPSHIDRTPSEQDPQLLAPFSQPIEIVVEFPDGFERNLLRSTLYVNNDPVAENSAAPFTHFSWDLSGYTESQQVLLRVEVQDELGLVGTSIELPVDLSVQSPPGWFQGLLARGGTTLALSVLLIAAGAFFLVLLLSGRLNPAQLRSARLFRAEREPAVRPHDPLRDSPPGIEANQSPASAVKTVFASEPEVGFAPAYLQRLTVQDANQPALIQPLDSAELLIGSDSTSNLVLEDGSVEKQHARLVLDPDGQYHIVDLGSHAGTWVNYAPVSPQGSRLQDGDIVHVGRVAFRFLLDHKNSQS